VGRRSAVGAVHAAKKRVGGARKRMSRNDARQKNVESPVRGEVSGAARSVVTVL